MSQGSELCTSRIQCIIGSTNIIKRFLVSSVLLFIVQSPNHNTKKCINAV